MTQPPTQAQKAARFRALHAGPTAFVIPNPWDAGTARLLAHAGFQALATTSVGLAFGLARPDGARQVSRDEALANAAAIVAAVDLPVSADLEDGYGETPDAPAETIRLAAATGLVGGSIEDGSGDAASPIRDFDSSVQRVRAAVAAARALPVDFILTARSENYVHGLYDLPDTIRRLQAYEAAGADVLYAPGLRTLDEVRAVCAAVSRPVNVVVGGAAGFTVAQLQEAGVRRISLGGALYRAAMGGLLEAIEEIRHQGTFGFGTKAPGFKELYQKQAVLF